MKKVIIVNCSPRRQGNCAAITDRLASDITNADVKVIQFADANINYCVGCDFCKSGDSLRCSQKDDMGMLLPELDSCDALIILSPIYWGDLSAQAKTFIDRSYAFFNPMHENMTMATKFGKKVAIITTNGGTPIDLCAKVASAFAEGLAVAGFTDNKVLAFGGVNEPGSVASIAEDMQQVDDLANWISE